MMLLIAQYFAWASAMFIVFTTESSIDNVARFATCLIIGICAAQLRKDLHDLRGGRS